MTILKHILDAYETQVTPMRGNRGKRRRFALVSGVNHTSIRDWRRRHNAYISNAEAVANALGYRVVLQDMKTGEVISDE
jgi:hypothetical protein